MLPAIEAGVAHEPVKDAQEEQEVDDDHVPILQQVLFEAILVGIFPRPPLFTISRAALCCCSFRTDTRKTGSFECVCVASFRLLSPEIPAKTSPHRLV